MKKTFKLTLLLITLMSFSSNKALAYDIAVENEGVTIYYNYSSDGTELEVTSGNSKYSGSVNIPEEVTYGGEMLKVTSIGNSAFYVCDDLTSITIPNNVTSIGVSAFGACSGLTSIDIPNSVTSIGDAAFLGCSSLTSITIPNSVTSIGVGITWGCTNLISLEVEETNVVYDSRDNCNAIISSDNELIAGCQTSMIPNSVTSIGTRAFMGCSGLSSVIIPNSVTSIGNEAFMGCSGLTSITIPNSVTSIGYRIFCQCSGLTSVTIPNSVTSIGNEAFFGCSGLTSINIPNSVTSIGRSSFECCWGLTSVIFPNSVKTLGKYAFHNCGALTSVTIPNSVTSIGENAFKECKQLTQVITRIVNPYIIYGINSSYTVFSYETFNSATLFVPSGTIEKYKSTAGWRDFRHIEEGNGNGDTPIIPGGDKCATPTIRYANKQLTFDCETEGVEFVSKITDSDIGSFSGSTIGLTATYDVSVYATKNGMEDSDVATATLVWIEAQFTTDESLGVKPMQAMPVLIQAENGEVSVQGVPEGTQVSVYDVNGRELGSNLSRGNNTRVSTQMGSGSVAVVKMGNRAVKVLMK